LPLVGYQRRVVGRGAFGSVWMGFATVEGFAR